MIEIAYSKFKKPIMSGQKIHWIHNNRKGDFRPGTNIYFFCPYNESPRIKKTCISVQKIIISAEKKIYVNSLQLSFQQVNQLVFNEGLNSQEEFFNYFPKGFIGEIMHTTTLKY